MLKLTFIFSKLDKKNYEHEYSHKDTCTSRNIYIHRPFYCVRISVVVVSL